MKRSSIDFGWGIWIKSSGVAGVQELQNGCGFSLKDVCLRFDCNSSGEPFFTFKKHWLLQLLNSCLLILNPAHRDSFNNELLGKEENHDNREHGHTHGGHHHREIAGGEVAAEKIHRDW